MENETPVESRDDADDFEVVSVDELKQMFGALGTLRVAIACNVDVSRIVLRPVMPILR